jgi:hypothetical protein
MAAESLANAIAQEVGHIEKLAAGVPKVPGKCPRKNGNSVFQV